MFSAFSERYLSSFYYQENDLHFYCRGINSFLLMINSARVLPSISLMKKGLCGFSQLLVWCVCEKMKRLQINKRSVRKICKLVLYLQIAAVDRTHKRQDCVCPLEMMERRWSLYENFFWCTNLLRWM